MTNELRRRAVFLCLVGPAGSGKTSHAEQLVKEFGPTVGISVSATTRAPRNGEENGVHYHFLTEQEFASRREKDELFECEQVHGKWYGTLKSTLNQAANAGTDLIFDIDIKGAYSVKQSYAVEGVIVFLVPPSASVLEQRIKSRGSLSEDELRTRMVTAQSEFRLLLDAKKDGGAIDYFVVNDDRASCYQKLRAILIAERAKLSRTDQGDLDKICCLIK